MDEQFLRGFLQQIQNSEISIEQGLEQLKDLPYKEMDFAKVDLHRGVRQGQAEVIFCPGKTSEQIAQIAQVLSEHSKNILATRATEENYRAVKAICSNAIYYPLSKLIIINQEFEANSKGIVLVVSAGTADLPVAEEALLTAKALGNKVEHLYDVGVAGLHRLLSNKDVLDRANVIIVVAGMEGALASVVGGLVNVPVVAVPTSVGYGANFNGLAPLLAMLNSCAAGVAVCNIDNGFGAGRLASMINRTNESNG